MAVDTPPQDNEILDLIGAHEGHMDPNALIAALCDAHQMSNVIEALQRAIERGKITLDSEGMVISTVSLAHAA
ncbi:hypothetical protein GGQ88_003277 [Novosphingobium hassiacum]|uniref:Uncharacterized protein n=1 Tax=Novosphingobium hassiacum TaxID=173676 RepID=A0A7W5ZZI4_9SPHN|nr:hypothetical protein [Novosphingobium hassiacum]MBB3861987.1 hypothetical protein [Novosphingobium hassiacum]